RPLNSSAPMVLWLKPWESRSLPGLPRTRQFLLTCYDQTKRRRPNAANPNAASPGKRRFFVPVFAGRAIFGHDGGRPCRQVHDPFISKSVTRPALTFEAAQPEGVSRCASSFAP